MLRKVSLRVTLKILPRVAEGLVEGLAECPKGLKVTRSLAWSNGRNLVDSLDDIVAESLADGLTESLADGLAECLGDGLAESLAEGFGSDYMLDSRRDLFFTLAAGKAFPVREDWRFKQ